MALRNIVKIGDEVEVGDPLIVFGIAFIIVENWIKHKEFNTKSVDQLTYKQSFIIGAFTNFDFSTLILSLITIFFLKKK